MAVGVVLVATVDMISNYVAGLTIYVVSISSVVVNRNGTTNTFDSNSSFQYPEIAMGSVATK